MLQNLSKHDAASRAALFVREEECSNLWRAKAATVGCQNGKTLGVVPVSCSRFALPAASCLCLWKLPGLRSSFESLRFRFGSTEGYTFETQ
jgi:hypothetical protein